MAKMSDEELLARDAKRNIAAEIRRGMKEVRAAHGTPFEAEVTPGPPAELADPLHPPAAEIASWRAGRARKPAQKQNEPIPVKRDLHKT